MEHKYRGKRIDNGEWVYGSLVKDRDKIYIFLNKRKQSFLAAFKKVHPDSVGMWTGIKDKTGKEIHEGDIIMDPSWWWGPCAIKHVSGDVGPCEGDNVMEWRLYREDEDVHNLWNGSEVEVIGNIHEHSELLTERSHK